MEGQVVQGGRRGDPCLVGAEGRPVVGAVVHLREVEAVGLRLVEEGEVARRQEVVVEVGLPSLVASIRQAMVDQESLLLCACKPIPS